MNNQLDDNIFRNISPCLSALDRLIILEISSNELGDESLTEIASIFPENKGIQEIILNNNKLGNSGSERHLVTFLESFLLELREPKKLDLSCNQFTDICLEPFIFYLLANYNCQITSLNLEYNAFTNYAKRTLAQASLLCPNSELKVKYGPMSLT